MIVSTHAQLRIGAFWRTLREGCLDYAGGLGSLHDVQVRLLAFLDQHYHQAPHASLLGRSPGRVWAEHQREPDELGEAALREPLTVHEPRRVPRDSTVPVDGRDWELDQGFLAGRVVSARRCLLDLSEPPWAEDEGKRLLLHPVDPVKKLASPATAAPAAHAGVIRRGPLRPAQDAARSRRRTQLRSRGRRPMKDSYLPSSASARRLSSTRSPADLRRSPSTRWPAASRGRCSSRPLGGGLATSSPFVGAVT